MGAVLIEYTLQKKWRQKAMEEPPVDSHRTRKRTRNSSPRNTSVTAKERVVVHLMRESVFTVFLTIQAKLSNQNHNY